MSTGGRAGSECQFDVPWTQCQESFGLKYCEVAMEKPEPEPELAREAQAGPEVVWLCFHRSSRTRWFVQSILHFELKLLACVVDTGKLMHLYQKTKGLTGVCNIVGPQWLRCSFQLSEEKSCAVLRGSFLSIPFASWMHWIHISLFSLPFAKQWENPIGQDTELQ